MKQSIATCLLTLVTNIAVAEEAISISGTFNLTSESTKAEHTATDCALTHLPLPEPPPEGQMFQLQMLSGQSAAAGPRVMVAGFVTANGSAHGTFGYRDDQDQQWFPSGEKLDGQQTLTITLDSKPFNKWVAAADRSKGEYLAELEFSTSTPLVIFTNAGIKPAGQTTASYTGQCWITIPWLPEGLYLQ